MRERWRCSWSGCWTSAEWGSPGGSRHAVGKPVRVAGREGERIVTGEQGVVVEHDAEVGRLWVGDHAPRVFVRAVFDPDPLVERELAGAVHTPHAAAALAHATTCIRRGAYVVGS